MSHHAAKGVGLLHLRLEDVVVRQLKSRRYRWATSTVVLFRVFDILKPWPVGWADRKIKGGLGIMLDDALAAGYAAAVLWGVAWAMAG